MKKQLRALGDFWREEYGRYVGMTAIAFLVLVVLAYIAGRLFPDIPVTVIGAFNELVADSGIVQEDGSFDVLALFGNNLRAMVLSILYGFSAKSKVLCFLIGQCTAFRKRIIELQFYVLGLRSDCQISDTNCRLIVLTRGCSNCQIYPGLCRTLERDFKIRCCRINLQNGIHNFLDCGNNACIVSQIRKFIDNSHQISDLYFSTRYQRQNRIFQRNFYRCTNNRDLLFDHYIGHIESDKSFSVSVNSHNHAYRHCICRICRKYL